MKNILFICILTNNGLRLLLPFSISKKQKGAREREREREREKRDLSLHSERNIFFFFFLHQSSFYFFFPSQTATPLSCSVCARTHTSNIVLFVVVFTCFLFFIHPSIYPSTTHYPRIKNKRKRQGSLWYCLSFFSSIKKMNLRRSIIINNQNTITKVSCYSPTNMNINHSYKTIQSNSLIIEKKKKADKHQVAFFSFPHPLFPFGSSIAL